MFMFLGGKVESSGSDCDSNLDSELSSNSLSAHYQTGELYIYIQLSLRISLSFLLSLSLTIKHKIKLVSSIKK